MLLTNSAAGGAPGTAVSTANSGGVSGNAWDAVNAGGSGSITFDDAHAHSGTLAHKIVADAAANVILTWDSSLSGSQTELWGRLYVFLDAVPTNNIACVWLRTAANAQVGRVRINPSGGGVILDVTDASNTVVQAGAVPVAIGQWIRIEWHAIASATAGTLTASLFNTPDSTTPDETVGASGTVAMAAGIDRVHYGRVAAASPPTFWLDDLGVSNVGALGPSLRTGGGTLTATATLTGTGTKIGSGGGTLTATVTLSGSGRDVTPVPSTFPRAPLDVRSELYIPGIGWVDTIDRALVRDPVTITRGRADENARPGPSKASLSLRDQEGKWSNRNPRSPYFGLLGRNTPLRIRVGDAPPYAYMPGTTGNYISTPDTAAIELNGYIDIRMEITPDSWRPNLLTMLASKMDWHSNQDSWTFMLRADGRLRFRWTATGASSANFSSNSSAAVPADSGRLAVRLVFNGADSAHGGVLTYTFYTAPSLAGPWEPLGAVDVGTAAGIIFSGSAPLEIGTAAAGTPGFSNTRVFHGSVHGFELRDGTGALIAGPGIADQTEGATAWTGPDGLPWATHGTTRLLRPARGHFEVASWPPSWHVSGNDVRVQLQAAGIRRRLSQGAAPLQSTLRRGVPADDTLVAYWPMEDAGGRCASAFAGQPPMLLARGASGVDFAASTDFVASAPLPTFGTGLMRGTVPSYTPEPAPPSFSATETVMFLCHMPSAPSTAVRLLQIWTTGSARRFDVWVSATNGGELSISAYNADGALIDWRSQPIVVPGRLLRVQVSFAKWASAPDIDCNLAVIEQGVPGSTSWGFPLGGGYTLGRITSVLVGGDSGEDLGGTTIGHVTVYRASRLVANLETEFNGYAGETAASRMSRLAAENEVPLVIRGELARTERVGPQRYATLLELLDEAADADGGILHESRDELGFEYRTRASMYNQARRVVLDYTARGEVPPELQPVEDDQAVRNDVTVTREGGSSARVVREDGPLSVLPPPDGVGTYDEAVTLNLADDDQAGDAAGWRTHLGTWDEARYPTVTMWPHTAGLSSPRLVDDIASLDVGDRFAVTNPPAWLPPADIDQLAQGYKEVLKPHAWEIEVNATPAGPWTVAVVDEARADTSGSVLAAAVDAAATGLVARPTSGPFWDRARRELFWTTDPADLPFSVVVGGEEMTVTAVAAPGDEVADTFSATVASGWGTADTGQPWTVAAGAAADFSAAAGTGGVITSGTVGVERGVVVDAGTPHQHVLAHSNTPVIPTGAPITWGFYLRYADPGSYYWVGVEIGTDSSLTLRIRKRVGGTLTLIASAPSATAHALSPWRILRAEAVGSQLRAKVWPAGALEPEWEIEATDTDLTAGTSLGCVVRRETGSTNGTTTAFDLLAAVPQAQTLTVVRSVNGIVKSHAAGTDVRLAHPAYTAR